MDLLLLDAHTVQTLSWDLRWASAIVVSGGGWKIWVGTSQVKFKLAPVCRTGRDRA